MTVDYHKLNQVVTLQQVQAAVQAGLLCGL